MPPGISSRHINIAACKLAREQDPPKEREPDQLTLFEDPAATLLREQQEEAALASEKRMQKAILDIRKRYGKNAILKGTNFQACATARERNGQVGGHRA